MVALAFVGVVSALTWMPRHTGPIDLRWDAASYYILGTSLAEGHGYRLLSEPGDIPTVLHPPLLPAIVALHQIVLRTTDWRIVGGWLRFSFFVCFLLYAGVTYIMLKGELPRVYAVAVACLGVLHWSVQFMSDSLFAELPFGLAAAWFFVVSRRNAGSTGGVLAGAVAAAAYALRTVGIALFAAWVGEAVLNRHVKQAAYRLLLVTVPILAWQSYVSAIQSRAEFRDVAYPYQRAAYAFPNVTYATNVFTFKDPFNPQLGQLSVADLARRVVRNAAAMPAALGEAMSSGKDFLGRFLPRTPVHVALTALGLLVVGGALVQLWRHEWLVPLYVGAYVGLMCLTPFQGQFSRYLVPVIPFLALWLVIALRVLGSRISRALPWVRAQTLTITSLAVIFSVQVVILIVMDTTDRLPSSYVDGNGKSVEYRLYFNSPMWQGAEAALEWIRMHAAPDAVVCAMDPHWAYLRSMRKTVLPPFESDPDRAQHLLDTVPVKYLLLQRSAPPSINQYMRPIVERHTTNWRQVFSQADGEVRVYERIRAEPAHRMNGE